MGRSAASREWAVCTLNRICKTLLELDSRRVTKSSRSSTQREALEGKIKTSIKLDQIQETSVSRHGYQAIQNGSPWERKTQGRASDDGQKPPGGGRAGGWQ